MAQLRAGRTLVTEGGRPFFFATHGGRMPRLKATLESLDGVDEALHPFYEEKDGAFVLTVDGIKEHPKVTALSNAFEKEKERREKLQDTVKSFGDVTPEDVEALREELAEAREGGDVDIEAKIEEVKEKLGAKHEKKIEELQAREEKLQGRLHTLLVENELSAALEKHQVPPEMRPAVRAMLKERGPTVSEGDDGPVGVFKESPDGIPGDHPIGDYVDAWVETDEAKPFLPASGKRGSGADADSRSGRATRPGTFDRSDPLAWGEQAEKIAEGEVTAA